ncbi:hypothetical protein Gasu2_44020 [Galdieria sulphuraria]|uniref:Uncharacterized protein n=1 Tax=Galdieria sulphuraria TaxID=130081 RepID=M2XVV4_GALSU|nr:uncharacterized protein Gasu_47640 [Galdieria sulphuraria]EME27778.1 hypothetical protein Gasu_47640 [Galdieria sulphuraria]GJD10194.1 hypothetical protein Gasu2_44020 [Galdieria sulphuraria]|eukprot:XP_005704298.1 hypothetical protein Gasu_47640 [Galdieria sulphuraria]
MLGIYFQDKFLVGFLLTQSSTHQFLEAFCRTHNFTSLETGQLFRGCSVFTVLPSLLFRVAWVICPVHSKTTEKNAEFPIAASKQRSLFLFVEHLLQDFQTEPLFL